MAGLSVGFGMTSGMNNTSGMAAGQMSRADMIKAARTGSVSELSAAQVRGLKKSGAVECATCASRKYQDGSDENVSFKNAAHISPSAAAGRVRAHEAEHVNNAYNKAAQGNGKVIRASVTLKTAICPECGRSYVAGGVTDTAIKYNESNPYDVNKKSSDREGMTGKNIDYAV